MSSRIKMMDEALEKEGMARVSTLAEAFDISKVTIYNWIRLEKLPSKKVGGTVYVQKELVGKLVEQVPNIDSKSQKELEKAGYADIKAVSDKYSLTRSNLYSWIHSGKVRAKRVGNKWTVLDADVRGRLDPEYLRLVGEKNG